MAATSPCGTVDWTKLPEDVLTRIFGLIPFSQRNVLMSVCRKWREVMSLKSMWANIVYTIPDDRAGPSVHMINIAKQFGHYHRNVTVKLTCADQVHRKLAIQLLRTLSDVRPRSIEHFKFEVVGYKTIFYTADDFGTSVAYFLSQQTSQEDEQVKPLISIQLQRAHISINEDILKSLHLNHGSTLTYVNLQISNFPCCIKPDKMTEAVSQMANLRDLRVTYCSINEATLNVLTDNKFFRHLSLLYHKCKDGPDYTPIGHADWITFHKGNGKRLVTVVVQYDYPRFMVPDIFNKNKFISNLLFELPVDQEMLTLMHNSRNTLTKITVSSYAIGDISSALISLITQCRRLKTMYLRYLPAEEVRKQILNRRPNLKHNMELSTRIQLRLPPEDVLLEPEDDTCLAVWATNRNEML
uniref:F-box domain-containing protein n=1 Tax=Trichuris muris TaxID=70415 RepID=A0A5S6R1E1_TRIMR